MSNMLYACSILYKTKLPMVLAFNKIDVVPCGYAMDWLRDSDCFQVPVQEMEVQDLKTKKETHKRTGEESNEMDAPRICA